MKIQLENEDMAEIFDADKIHVGAYARAVEAVTKLQKLPWCATSNYVHAVLNSISSFYREQENKKEA